MLDEVIDMSKKVYLNHDGGVDDLISLFLLLQMEDVELIGVGVIPTNDDLKPALFASEKIINRFGHGITVEVSSSISKGKNLPSNDSLMHAFYVNALPVLNEFGIAKPMIVERPAHLHLVDILRSSEEKMILLFTGPLTDLARALDHAPDIEEKIEKLIWTGGTLLEKSNIEEIVHDSTVGRNPYGDLDAISKVWDTSIEIDLVALESKNELLLTNDVRAYWARNRQDIGIEFLGQCYAMVPPIDYYQNNSTYLLWDVLTTLIVADQDFAKWRINESKVRSNGTNVWYELVSNERKINLIYDVDKKMFFEYMTDLARQE